MKKLDSEFKAKWTAALRSGKFKQCTNTLHRNGGHCCLGVAEIVLGLKSEDSKVLEGEDFPEIIRGKAGKNPHVADLTEMNDNGKTFSEIADYIEANL